MGLVNKKNFSLSVYVLFISFFLYKKSSLFVSNVFLFDILREQTGNVCKCYFMLRKCSR